MPEGDAPDDPTAAFRARARAFLEAHARPRRSGEDDFARFRFLGDPSPEADAEHVRRCKEWQRTLFDEGWAGHRVAEGVRRARRHARRGSHLRSGAGALRRRRWRVRRRHRDGRADADRARHRSAEAAVPPGAAARRRGVVPAVQRAGRRVRPRRAADPRRARRRRVGRRRAEGLELGRAPQRARHPAGAHRPGRAEAQGHHVLRARHALARDRGAAAAPDQRRRALQRGVPDRRADPARERGRRGERRVGCRPDDARRGACADRQRRRGRVPRSGPPGGRAAADRGPGPASAVGRRIHPLRDREVPGAAGAGGTAQRRRRGRRGVGPEARRVAERGVERRPCSCARGRHWRCCCTATRRTAASGSSSS